MRAGFRRLSWALLLVSSGWGPAAWAQCGGTSLCAPAENPCVIAAGTTCTATAGTFDLGTRALVVEGDLRFAGPLPTVITAGDVTVAASGRLLGLGDTRVAGNLGGSVRVVSQGAFKVERSGGTLGLVSVSGPGGGGRFDLTAQGEVVMDGRILAKGSDNNTNGGAVSLQALSASVTVAGEGIEATAVGSEGGGGTVQLQADAGDVLIKSKIDASKGYCGVCQIDVQAARDIALTGDARLDVSSTAGLGDDGGFVEMTAGGAIDIAGPITAKGSGEFGSGGSVDIVSTGGGSVTVSADITADGTMGGDGGSFSVATGGKIDISGTVVIEGGGLDSGGGDAIIGDLTQDLPSAVFVSGEVRASGLDFGGEIDVLAVETVSIPGKLKANGGSAGGVVTLGGCNVTVPPTGLLETRPAGNNFLQAGGPMLVQGDVKAGVGGSNVLEYRGTLPIVAPTAVVDPAALVQQNFDIPCCTEGCVPATTITTASTTTTTGAPTTTSTTVASTSTTVAATSTTAPQATTTTVVVTTTTAALLTTTTTTPVPVTCEDLGLAGYDAIGCRLELTSAVLTEQADATLGGTRSAKRFKAQLSRVQAAIKTARAGKRVAPSLRRAKKQLGAFDRGITAATGRGMPAAVVDRLRPLVNGAASEIGALARARRSS